MAMEGFHRDEEAAEKPDAHRLRSPIAAVLQCIGSMGRYSGAHLPFLSPVAWLLRM
jgi:hypothetical protein